MSHPVLSSAKFFWLGGPKKQVTSYSKSDYVLREYEKVFPELAYEESGLLDDTSKTLHASKMLSYRQDLQGTELSNALLRLTEHSEAHYELIGTFLAVDGIYRIIILLTQWSGLPEPCELIWQPLLHLNDYKPELLCQFLRQCTKYVLERKAKKLSALTTEPSKICKSPREPVASSAPKTISGLILGRSFLTI